MPGPSYPSLYQLNTRVCLNDLGRSLGRPATLDDLPDDLIDDLADHGFDWIWLLGVWQTGIASRQVSRTRPEFRQEFAQTLPDLSDDDIPGSCFAITAYTVADSLGGPAALARLRTRLAKRGLRLMLDFVPNHTALDHPWTEQHPDFYIVGDPGQLASAPANFTRVTTPTGERIVAHGRDPFFPGWPDTLQLDYANPATQTAMAAELLSIASQCDGVRCDMAMLVLPDVFERTWGRRPAPFWPDAIRMVRQQQPDFTFLAEVYWDLEWTLLEQGFDCAYDKRLYDRLRAGNPRSIRDHLHAGLDYQRRLARFLENHDEPRAAATFGPEQHPAAAVVCFLAPGLRFFHQGQFEGRCHRVSPHLGRAPVEATDTRLARFYARLLEILRRPEVRDGRWTLAACTPAWEGNGSSDAFIAYAWELSNGPRLLVAVNYATHSSQCYLHPPLTNLGGNNWILSDLLGDAVYQRNGDELQSRGLYLDMNPWQAHVFALNPIPA